MAEREWLIGPRHGAERLLMLQSEYPAGFFVGLHRHDGEEAFYVLSGQVRFTLDGTHRVCGPGEATMAPTGSEHGFLILEDAVMLIIREQELGSVATVIEPDGTRREVETVHGGPPWARAPRADQEPMSAEEIQAFYRTTHHLL